MARVSAKAIEGNGPYLEIDFSNNRFRPESGTKRFRLRTGPARSLHGHANKSLTISDPAIFSRWHAGCKGMNLNS